MRGEISPCYKSYVSSSAVKQSLSPGCDTINQLHITHNPNHKITILIITNFTIIVIFKKEWKHIHFIPTYLQQPSITPLPSIPTSHPVREDYFSSLVLDCVSISSICFSISSKFSLCFLRLSLKLFNFSASRCFMYCH